MRHGYNYRWERRTTAGLVESGGVPTRVCRDARRWGRSTALALHKTRRKRGTSWETFAIIRQDSLMHGSVLVMWATSGDSLRVL